MSILQELLSFHRTKGQSHAGGLGATGFHPQAVAELERLHAIELAAIALLEKHVGEQGESAASQCQGLSPELQALQDLLKTQAHGGNTDLHPHGTVEHV